MLRTVLVNASHAIALLYHTGPNGQWPSHAQLVALLETPSLIDALLTPDVASEALDPLQQPGWWSAPTVTPTLPGPLRPLQDRDYLACHGQIWQIEQGRLVLHETSRTLGLSFSSRATFNDTEPLNVAQLRQLVKHLSRVTLLPNQRAVQYQERLSLTIALHTGLVVEKLMERNQRRARQIAANLTAPDLTAPTVTTELELFDPAGAS